MMLLDIMFWWIWNCSFVHGKINFFWFFSLSK